MRTLVSLISGLLVLSVAGAEEKGDQKVPPVLNFKMKSLAGKEVDLSQYKGKVVLIVNVASQCGYTPQYKGLQALHDKYVKEGLVVLGVPSNDFGQQEPGTSEEIAALAPGVFDGDGYHAWYFRTPDGETYDGFSGRIAAWLAETEGQRLIVVCHGVVTRVLRGLYAGLPRAVAMRLPVPQDRIFRLAGGRIEEVEISNPTTSAAPG